MAKRSATVRPTPDTEIHALEAALPKDEPIPKAILELIFKRKSLRVDLGCGANKQPGSDIVGIDARPLPGVDIVHNLQEYPWPLPTDSVRVCFMSHFWEHIDRSNRGVMRFMEELHRVMQHDGQVLISAPYGTEFRFVQDPTHVNPTNEATFCYWDRAHESGLWHVYTPPVFHLEVFDIIPAGASRDFNAILRCCKADSPETCKHDARG